jgi:hypothetical protein
MEMLFYRFFLVMNRNNCNLKKDEEDFFFYTGGAHLRFPTGACAKGIPRKP